MPFSVKCVEWEIEIEEEYGYLNWNLARVESPFKAAIQSSSSEVEETTDRGFEVGEYSLAEVGGYS